MAAISKDSVDQFRVAFGELAKVRRGEPVLVDPFLIGRAISLVMRECTVRSAAGRPMLWNQYRVILARRDFELVRTFPATLEQDLQQVLAQEAAARQAELIGPLRITVVFDEADELRAGDGVVRVSFVPAEKALPPVAGEITVLFSTPGETQFVPDTQTGPGGVVQWPGGEAPVALGATVIAGRPHAGAPAGFVSLTGAGAKVNKQHLWLALGATSVRVGRFPTSNPVHVNGQAVAAGHDVEAPLPAEVSLSRGDLVLVVRRR